jgi:crossover junction endodeoxyribonuclease RuvC
MEEIGMLVLGADPGLDGAIALISDKGILAINDMPTLNLARGGKEKREPDLVELSRIIDAWSTQHAIAAAYVEKVASSPQMGKSSAFAFGKGFGGLLGVIAAHFIPTVQVAPVTWKRAVGIKAGSGKDASLALVKSLWPGRADLFARAKDDGRAEACLIGWHGLHALRKRAE